MTASRTSPGVRRVCVASLFLHALCLTSSSATPRPDHYRFILPSGYIGWVQIVFAVPGGSPLPISEDKRALVVRIEESGVVRTREYWIHSPKPKDEFFYQSQDPSGVEKLIAVPPDYFVDDGYNTHGGFGINGTPENSPGYSFFFFVGPPEIRDQTPGADIRKVPGFGKKREAPPAYPTPGRVKSPTN